MNEPLQSPNSHQQEPGTPRADFGLLKSVFGAALVAIRNDVVNRGLMLLGSDPLPATAVDPDILPMPAAPAGVLCGPITRLLALNFVSGEELRGILSANPTLSGALILRNRAGYVLWLRPNIPLPPAQKLKTVTVTSESVVIPVYHPDASAMPVSVHQRGIPLETDLSGLALTGPLNDVITDAVLRHEHGDRVVKVSRSRSEINPRYWAAWLSRTTGLQFDVGRSVFVAKLPGGKPIIVAANKVPVLIATVLQQARQRGVPIPAEEVQPRRINAIFAAIKMFHSVNDATEEEVLNEFAATFIEAKPGGMLSKNALTGAFLAYRRARDLPNYNENRMRFNLRKTILQRFGVGESHHRGRVYCGLALRTLAGSQKTDPQTTTSPVASATGNSQGRTAADCSGQNGRVDGTRPVVVHMSQNPSPDAEAVFV